MATESIQMNVVIKDKHAAEKLANALEQAARISENEAQAVVSYAYASGDKIRSMFSDVSE